MKVVIQTQRRLKANGMHEWVAWINGDLYSGVGGTREEAMMDLFRSQIDAGLVEPDADGNYHLQGEWVEEGGAA